MARTKARRPKKNKNRSSKRSNISLKTKLIKNFFGLAVLILLVLAGVFLVRHLIPAKPPQYAEKQLDYKAKKYSHPEFEIYPKEEISRDKPSRVPDISKPEAPLSEKLPRIALIIDDLGYDKKIADKFSNLDAILTFSILPHSPFHKEIAEKGHQKGNEIMLHLPMEPIEYPKVNPGPGALLTSMSPNILIQQLNINLDAVPFIKGVNNHMGSRMTTISTQMYQIFSILKKKGVFFIDSRTTSETLCKPAARLLQLHFIERDIFLDHIQTPDSIRNQINRLVQTAKARGVAVGIGHPYAVTYETLRDALPKLQKQVRLVPASEIVYIVGS